jgi:2-dehydro-3-deoxyphosphogluconate aldolase/(4S)-4-hydroxy-2-oxoglutarate aldolase
MATREKTLKTIREVGVVPVVRAESADEALKIVDAVLAGGVNILEITMTVPGAIGVMETVAKRFGDKVLLGAGTVLDAETARAALLAGAEFVVSPGTNLDVIHLCRRYSKPVLPGALTPTEVVNAWQAGADVVKVFPCDAVGGPKYIKALKGPLPQVEMVPTGGVSLTTTVDFIKAGAVAVCVGGELIDKAAVKAGKFEVLTENARKFVHLVKSARA